MDIKEMLDIIEKFEELDNALLRLGFSNSSIMYAPHIRDEFDDCINKLNSLKELFGMPINKQDWYFDWDNFDDLKIIEELEGDDD